MCLVTFFMEPHTCFLGVFLQEMFSISHKMWSEVLGFDDLN